MAPSKKPRMTVKPLTRSCSSAAPPGWNSSRRASSSIVAFEGITCVARFRFGAGVIEGA